MAAHQALLSLGFSRQEHWSGLPFPSSMHKSEKWKWSRSVVSDSSWPHGLQPTGLLCPWDFPGTSTEVGCHCLLHSCAAAKRVSSWARPVTCSQVHQGYVKSWTPQLAAPSAAGPTRYSQVLPPSQWPWIPAATLAPPCSSLPCSCHCQMDPPPPWIFSH